MRYRMDYHSRKNRCLDRYNYFTAYANATFHISFHFNSFNLLFKAVPNLVQNIPFEKYTRTTKSSDREKGKGLLIKVANYWLYTL